MSTVFPMLGGGGAGTPGPEGPQGPEGPPGPAGSAVPNSICGKWVEEPGVFGVDTPFVIEDWQDVSSVAPNSAAASVVTAAVIEDALRIIPTSTTNAGAVNFLLGEVADGDDVCFRIAAQNQASGIGTGNTHRVMAAVFQDEGSSVPWIGAGFERSNISWGSTSNPTVGRYGGATTVAGAALGADTATGITSAALYTAFDVRIRRVGTGVTVWMAFMGGPWMTIQSGGTTVNMALGTIRAGVRVQCNSGQNFAVSLLAFKHFAGGLPANLLQA